MNNVILNLKNKIKDEYVVIACSTGIDSCVLLNLCMNALNNNQIIIAHCNHGVRLESNIEEEYIRKFSKENNIKLEIAQFNFNDLSNFESVARSKRYEFFEKVAQKYNAKYILLAHHANDNLETMIMRFIKQSSLKGYAGIEEESVYKDYILYRPLLKFSRLEIEVYANNNNIKYFNDSTNTEYDHLRNRIRLDLVPLLLKENPNLIDAVNYYNETLLNAASLLEDTVNCFIKNSVYIDDTIIKFKITEFLKLSNFLQKEVLFTLLKKYSFSTSYILELLKIINNNKTKVVSKLQVDLIFIKEYGNITFIKKELKEEAFCLKIEKNGTYELLNNTILEVNKNSCYYKAGNRVVCYNILNVPFTIRTRKDGDKIKLFDKTVTKSFKKLFCEAKTDLAKRDNLAVLEDERGVLLLYGFGAAQKAAVTEQTKKVLIVEKVGV